jgi:quercetin dioxygenase-like cupin family protein
VFVEQLQGGVNLTGCAARIVAIYENFLQPGQTIQPHFHPDAEELYYLIAGHGIMHIGEERRDVAPGDVIYIPPDKVHFLQNSSAEPIRFLKFTVRITRAELMPYIL